MSTTGSTALLIARLTELRMAALARRRFEAMARCRGFVMSLGLAHLREELAARRVAPRGAGAVS